MSPAARFVSSRLSPFKIKEFRYLYFAQLFSWIGSWMQDMGKSWLVLSLFGRGKEMGMLMIASAIPVACFGIYAGTYADKNNSKRILTVTQFALFGTALLLAVFSWFGILKFWQMIMIAFIEGLCIAFDAPAFQVILPRIVGKENLQQTLALNSSSFHLSRIIGPAIGGLLLSMFNVSSIFFINALSFLAVSLTILSFKKVNAAPANHKNNASFKDFIKFLWGHTFFAKVLVQFLIVMTFIFPHTFTTMRLLVTERFHLDGHGFGLLLTGPGLGAFLGSTLLVIVKPQKPYQLFPWGLCGIVVFGSLILVCNDFWTMNALLMFYTLSLFLYLSSLLVSLQITTDHSLRGRLGALVTMVFAAWSPLWSAVWGWCSDHFGSPNVFTATGLVFLFLSLLVMSFWKRFFNSLSLEPSVK
jgi:MFS family permease